MRESQRAKRERGAGHDWEEEERHAFNTASGTRVTHSGLYINCSL